MFKKWFAMKTKKQETVYIQIEKETEKTSLLDLVNTPQKETDVTNALLNGLKQFRKETKSLDYLRHEIETVYQKKDGEKRLLEGFARPMNRKKTNE